MSNYIAGINPFKLAGPPRWWLTKLKDFDPSLVVIPSKQGFYYRLAQRRKPTLSTKIVTEALYNDSDTQMLASYSLIPVTTILATADWTNPLMFQDLAARCPWRQGGAEAYEQKVEAVERQKELDQQLKMDDIKTQLAKDAWGLYLKKIGLRSQMYSPRVKAR